MQKSIYIDALPLVQQKKSGVGVALENTIRALLKLKDFNYKVYLVVPLGKAKYLPDFHSSAVATKTVPLPAKIMELLLRAKLMLPIDLILGKGVYIFSNFRNWPLTSSRSITYIHDITFLKYPKYVQLKNQKYLNQYIHRWINRADKIVAVSNYSKQEIHKYLWVPESKIEVVYNGVDLNLYYRRPLMEVTKVKKKYQVNFENYFLYVGNIEPRKNLSTLIDAYTSLPKHIKERHGLLIVGSDGWNNGSVFEKIQMAVKNGEAIKKIDQYVLTEDLPALYTGATFLVHPALYEGFGITPIEAMACQTPVISSNAGSLSEVISGAAILFDPNDKDQLVNAISGLLNSSDKRKLLMSSGLQRAKKFSWEQAAGQLFAVVINQHQNGPRKGLLRKLLRDMYKLVDEQIRSHLGEKQLEPYRVSFSSESSQQEMANSIYTDYLNEQPNMLQKYSLDKYLLLRHGAASLIKMILQLKKRIRI